MDGTQTPEIDWDAYTAAIQEMPLLGVDPSTVGYEELGRSKLQFNEVDPRGIENLPTAAHDSYRQVAILLAYLDRQRKDPLTRSREQLLYQLKNHTIDVFSRVGYISLTTEFTLKFNFETIEGRNFLVELMLRSPKLAKLGVTEIDLAEAAPVSRAEQIIIGRRKLMPQWLVDRTVDSMRGKYEVQTTIHNNTLYVGNESLSEVLRVIDGAGKAQNQIEEGKAPGSNPALPIATEVQLKVREALTKEPVNA